MLNFLYLLKFRRIFNFIVVVIVFIIINFIVKYCVEAFHVKIADFNKNAVMVVINVIKMIFSNELIV